MRSYKRWMYAFIFALIVFFVSIFANIVPCQTSPDLPDPHYTWGFCNLNPDLNNNGNLVTLYLGYTPSLSQTYLLVLIISFITAATVLHFTARTKKKEKQS